jgi:hypothetical protein
MMEYEDGDGKLCTAYGELINIYKHKARKKDRARVVVQVEWFTTVGTLHKGRMQKVIRDPKSDRNREDHFEFMERFLCQEAVFWPVKMRNVGGEMVCITRPLNRLHAQQKLAKNN